MIYDYVRNRRKELNLTQKQLADLAKVSVNVVRRFEDKRPYNPFGRTFIKYCKALQEEGTFMLLECEWP